MNNSSYNAIIRRFDVTGDGKITFNEFSDVLNPINNEEKSKYDPDIKMYNPRKFSIAESVSPKRKIVKKK
jgi:hypothetical protein